MQTSTPKASASTSDSRIVNGSLRARSASTDTLVSATARRISFHAWITVNGWPLTPAP